MILGVPAATGRSPGSLLGRLKRSWAPLGATWVRLLSVSSAVLGLLGRLLSMASRDHFAVVLRCREGKASTEESCHSPLQLVSDGPGTSAGVGIPPCDNQTTRAHYQRCHKLSRFGMGYQRFITEQFSSQVLISQMMNLSVDGTPT